MISQTKNRVQAIKNKFENLQQEPTPVLRKNSSSFVSKHLSKPSYVDTTVGIDEKHVQKGNDKENTVHNFNETSRSKQKESESDSSEEWSPKPNSSYLYDKSESKHTFNDVKKSLVRQSSDPGKKLHRSHAFRCDRSQVKIVSPKRHGSYNGKEIGEFSMKMGEKRLSKERLKRLGNFLEDQMRKEHFVPVKNEDIGEIQDGQRVNDSLPDLDTPQDILDQYSKVIKPENFVPFKNENLVEEIHEVQKVADSLPDSAIPQHILDQYAKVIKPKKKDPEAMTDSGVSSETENLEEEKTGRIKKLMSQFEKSEKSDNADQNLDTMVDLCASSETMKLERKNPHLKLTDTLKKALKQPLPAGPPPKKPPRMFTASPIQETLEKPKKDARKMLEKLEQALQKREQNQLNNRNDYDIVEGNENESESNETENNEYDLIELRPVAKKPKEIHYLCTEILNINKPLPDFNQNSGNNCFKSLNCTLTNSTVSLPYTRLSLDSNKDITNKCSCSNEELDLKSRRLSSFLSDNKCVKCKINENNNGFKCHLNCKCRLHNSEFFVDNEHIYDEPCVEVNVRKKSKYGTLNLSKSMEDLRIGGNEYQKIYDIPSEVSRPGTPEFVTSSPKTDFQKLRQNFEASFQETETKKPRTDTSFNETSVRKTLSAAEIKRLSASDVNKWAEKPKFATEKPPMKPKPIFVKKASMSVNNVADDDDNSVGKFATETKRYRKQRGETRFSLPKKDSTQLDIDRENLNRLMNEIYVTVTEACNMEKPASFPTGSDSTSEDSVKLTRSLTEKRKNYVRRVSSKVAYLDRKNTRFRHQTSVCSYKSEVVDPNPYNTFRSWKSFRRSTSHVNIDNSKMADSQSIDSKFNLTDSKGNLLSMKDEFDCSDSIDNLSIDEKTGCVDITLPFERERGLFNICLLVGLNYMTGQAYVKSVFPEQVQVPPHIENLVFPETLTGRAADSSSQCHSIVLTDERGERNYGYCRRVLPEGATTCLPLCYCLIGKYRAPGFYYKVLQEIESHHGSSEVEIHSILQQLFETDFPYPGEEITITYTKTQAIHKSYKSSLNVDDVKKCQTMPDMRRSDQSANRSDQSANRSDRSVNKSDQSANRSDQSPNKSELLCNDREVIGKSDFDRKCEAISDRLPDFYDVENNNSPKRILLSVESPKIKTLKRPIDPRSDEHNISVLTECLGAGLTIKVLGSLLLERKVIIVGDQLSQVSSCMEALQAILYPFVWQQPLISIVPSEIEREVLEAPLPLLAGVLKKKGEVDTSGVAFEEGMLIDLTHPSKVLFYQGDESTIIPTSSYKTLKTTLQMETKQKEKQDSTRNIMIAEAFLRFFADILGDFWRCFSVGELKEGMLGRGDVIFDKEGFIKQTSSKQNQYFLEWFTETAMFTHFIQNMAVIHGQNLKTDQQNGFAKTDNSKTGFAKVDNSKTGFAKTNICKSDSSQDLTLVDTPLPDFYGLFQDRVKSRIKPEPKICENKNSYKNAVNKRVKLLKNKLRELVT